MEIYEISKIIKDKPLEAAGYIMLGDYLLGVNIKQAYLCYENAQFYSRDDSEKKELEKKLELIRSARQAVPKAAIIILSYNLREDVLINIESIKKTTPESAREIIVVDNASEDDSVVYLQRDKDIIFKANDKNEGFPKGCNQGIELAGKDSDIFLLNNDTIMMPNTLFWLRMGLYAKEEHGAAGCVTNNIDGTQKVIEKDLPPDEYYRYALENNVYRENSLEYRPLLVGFALLIKRTVVNKIGLLDESFFPGNYEDDDYCLRILKAGYSNVVVHNSFLVHSGSKSFRKRNDYTRILTDNKARFESMHDIYDSDFVMKPNSILSELFAGSFDLSGEKSVLELNYNLGAFIDRISFLYPNISVEGISTRRVALEYADKNRPEVLKAADSVAKYRELLGERRYDYIVVNCYQDDETAIEDYIDITRDYLKADGKAVFVLENSRFYGYWLPILLGKKPERNVCKISQTNEKFVEKIAGKLNAKRWIFEYKYPEDEITKKLISNIDELTVGLGYKREEVLHIRYYIVLEHV